MSCNGSSTLYCSPTLDAVLFENQTYTFDYNAQFHSIAGDSNVDIYLYAANGSSPAQVFSDMPNDGEMTFTINDVSTSLFPWGLISRPGFRILLRRPRNHMSMFGMLLETRRHSMFPPRDLVMDLVSLLRVSTLPPDKSKFRTYCELNK
jgi:hypothetical protein